MPPLQGGRNFLRGITTPRVADFVLTLGCDVLPPWGNSAAIINAIIASNGISWKNLCVTYWRKPKSADCTEIGMFRKIRTFYSFWRDRRITRQDHFLLPALYCVHLSMSRRQTAASCGFLGQSPVPSKMWASSGRCNRDSCISAASCRIS